MRAALFLLALCLWPIGVMGQPTPGFGAGAGNASASGYTPDDGANWTDPDPTTVAGALNALAAAAAGVITAALQDLDDVGVVGAADKFLYSAGAGVWAFGDVTAAGRALLDDAAASDQRTTLELGALATGDDASDILYTCGAAANWTGGLCPGTPAAALDDAAARIVTLEGATVDAADVTFTPTAVGNWTGDADPGNADDALDDLAGRVETLEGAGGGGRWDWTQEVGSPAAADWTDANAAGADVSLSTLADCTVGDCVRFVPGASTTDRYGATIAVGAGDFTRCALLAAVNPGASSFGATQSGRVGFVFVDGTNLDTDMHYGIHTVAIADDMAARLLYVQDSNGGGTDEWDAAWTPDVQDGYPSYRIETCFSRSGTDLNIYFSPNNAGWVKAVGYTVTAGAGLMAIVIDEDDAVVDEAVLYSFGDPGGLPWE